MRPTDPTDTNTDPATDTDAGGSGVPRGPRGLGDWPLWLRRAGRPGLAEAARLHLGRRACRGCRGGHGPGRRRRAVIVLHWRGTLFGHREWVASCDQCGHEIAVRLEQADAEAVGRFRGCSVCGTRPARRRRGPWVATPKLLNEPCPACERIGALAGAPCPACLGRGRVGVLAELALVAGGLARWRLAVREAAAAGEALPAARLLADGRVVYGVDGGWPVAELDHDARRRLLLSLVDDAGAATGAGVAGR